MKNMSKTIKYKKYGVINYKVHEFILYAPVTKKTLYTYTIQAYFVPVMAAPCRCAARGGQRLLKPLLGGGWRRVAGGGVLPDRI
jgi:hypothetical protein